MLTVCSEAKVLKMAVNLSIFISLGKHRNAVKVQRVFFS